MILEFKDVSYRYTNSNAVSDVLRHVSCGFEQGKAYAIMGKSGSGKSTALMLMAGLDLPGGGDVLYEGTPTSSLMLDLYRRENASLIYQSFRLFPLLTAAENVSYPMELRGVPPREAMSRARDLIREVGLGPDAYDRLPGRLSGGEQQRVAIARALAQDSRLLLADEPTGNLDSENSRLIIDMLCGLAHEKGYCVIIVTHDLDIMTRVDAVYHMRDGQLYKHPQ